MDTLKGKICEVLKVGAALNVPQIIYPPNYTGDYTVTPTNQTQILQTSELYMLDNITINPIPNNYGLITWDGAVLTVS